MCTERSLFVPFLSYTELIAFPPHLLCRDAEGCARVRTVTHHVAGGGRRGPVRMHTRGMLVDVATYICADAHSQCQPRESSHSVDSNYVPARLAYTETGETHTHLYSPGGKYQEGRLGKRLLITFPLDQTTLSLIFFSFFADGLRDCADSKCCGHASCRLKPLCMSLADPVEVLLRKSPPSPDSTFFQRVQFIFEGEGSVQSYVKKGTFKEK